MKLCLAWSSFIIPLFMILVCKRFKFYVIIELNSVVCIDNYTRAFDKGSSIGLYFSIMLLCTYRVWFMIIYYVYFFRSYWDYIRCTKIYSRLAMSSSDLESIWILTLITIQFLCRYRIILNEISYDYGQVHSVIISLTLWEWNDYQMLMCNILYLII